jgi:hypothetical protein
LEDGEQRSPAHACASVSSTLAHAIKIDDVKRFPDRLNVADVLLNRLSTGLRPAVQHMRAAFKWTEMPAIYGTLCATEGMPAKALRMLIVGGAPHAEEVFGRSGAR